MKWTLLSAMVVAGTSALIGCNDTPVQRVDVPGAADTSAYRPVPMHKPMPGVGEIPGLQPGFGQPPAGAPLAAAGINNEAAFMAAYQKRRPRIMVFVNRNLAGDAAGGANAQDYEMLESSIVRYFNPGGQVMIMDSEQARARLTREQLLRIENGDPQANRLLAIELQADLLIRVSATPTNQAAVGQAVRLNAKAVSTTDARNLGVAFVDMPLPATKTNINIYTRYLSEELMGQMAQLWSLPPQFDPVEVRIYKAATVDDSLKIAQWIQKTPGVSAVRTNSATGGSNTSYASLAVGFGGAPQDLYFLMKDGIGMSTGIKAVDLQMNTISLEVTGPMNLVTTTRHVETTTTTETRTTDERRIEPILPAPAPGGGGMPAGGGQ